jgi:hypothetical protein
MKESLFKRVAAIENKGVGGVQITTLRDFVLRAHMLQQGVDLPPANYAPGLKDFIHSAAESWRQQKQQEAWSMWERWLA